MSIAAQKITEYAKNIADLPDKPQMTAAALKAFFDGRTNEEVKSSINGLVDALISALAAAELGAKDAEGLASTVQEELDKRPDAGSFYTKQEVETRITQRIQDIGAGDMASGTYDPTGKSRDVFAYADAAAAGVEETLESAINQMASTLSGLQSTVTGLSARVAALEQRQNIQMSLSGDTLNINW